MPSVYLKSGDSILRVLGINNGEITVINVTRPFSTIYEMSSSEEYEEVTAPLVTIQNDDELYDWQRKKRDQRYEIIEFIVREEDWWRKDNRKELLQEASSRFLISKKTLTRMLWQYLTYGKNGLCPEKKTQKDKDLTADQKNMRWALNKYYYTTDKNFLTYAYTQMLLMKYTDSSGTLKEKYPSMRQFRYYYSSTKNSVNEIASRYGKSYFERNNRPLLGSSRRMAGSIGIFMTDSTLADIYLVNRLTRNSIGRPNIYAMIDTFSGLIVAIHVGFETGIDAIRLLLINMCEDKVEVCKRFGITIEPWQWPSTHIPFKIITDRGYEFMSDIVHSFCSELDIEVEHLKAYRPDNKGMIESFFGTVQNAFKGALSQNGVIRPDYLERGAPDYRAAATLDLYQFTNVILQTVVYFNSKHVVNGFSRTPSMISDNLQPIPCHIWEWCMTHMDALREADIDVMFLALLPRANGKITRQGLIVNKIQYSNPDFFHRFVDAGVYGKEDVRVAYMPENVDVVWLIENGNYIRFTIVNNEFEGLSVAEITDYYSVEADSKKQLHESDLQAKLTLSRGIQNIAQASKSMKSKNAPDKKKRIMKFQADDVESEQYGSVDMLRNLFERNDGNESDV